MTFTIPFQNVRTWLESRPRSSHMDGMLDDILVDCSEEELAPL